MIKLIVVPIWNRKVLVVTPPHDPLKAVRRHRLGNVLAAQLKGEVFDGADAGLVYFDDTRGRFLLWFPNRTPSTDTIIHETNHLVELIMDFIGAHKEKEAKAYTQEYLYREIRKALRIKKQ